MFTGATLRKIIRSKKPMIQRKQTIFLLAAVLLTIICLCMPLGTFVSESVVGEKAVMYNLWIAKTNAPYDFSVLALFAILLLTCPIGLLAIFTYRNRIAQSRFCMFNVLLVLGWYVVYVVMALNLKETLGHFNISYSSVLPAVSIILYIMARKAILADEALVRSADRIR